MSWRPEGWEITGNDDYDNTDGQNDAYCDGFEGGADAMLAALEGLNGKWFRIVRENGEIVIYVDG